MKSIRINAELELPGAARQLLAAAGGLRVFALYGKMGAGKTTLVRALCHELGVEERSSSPTYALVNEYLDSTGEPVYHFDFYRIESVDEAYDMGLEVYLDSGHYCLIEWPERVEEILPEGLVKVHLEVEGEVRIMSWESS